jgi:hypothetical protein
MLSLLSLCAVAVTLSPASADPALLGPAAAGEDKWPVDSPAEAPVTADDALFMMEGTGEDKAADFVADDGIIAVPGRRRFRAHHHAALSPEARRELNHEAHCGPRVPVLSGFPWPGRNPRCRGVGDGAAGAPVVRRLFPVWSP